VVCDGVGGAAAGEVASRLAVEQLTASLAASSGPLEARLGSGIRAGNTAIRGYARRELDGAPSGSTIVAALLTAGHATIAHVGDSRAYLYRSGSLSLLTVDHSFVAEQVKAGLIRPEDAPAHPLRGRLMKALGIADTVVPDVREIELQPGDLLVLCSDGLHAMASDVEIARTLQASSTDTADALIKLANDRGGKDNVTVAVWRVP